MSLPLLQLNQVEAGYGSTLCLHGISLEVKEGEVVTLLGANGAGKTTTLMVISGMVPVHKGMVLFRQAPLNGVLPSQVVEQGISHVPEGRRILPQLTVQENLILGTFQRKDKAQIEADQKRLLEWFPVLAQRKRQLAGTLSGGEQQMLAIARGLMGRPKLLLLDEPSLGLAPKLVAVLFEIIRRINTEGVTILLVEQNAHLALSVANRGYVLEAGKIVLCDTAEHLAKDPLVKTAYLGG